MENETAREIDQNGYVTIQRNPITRAGVFQYSGRSLPGADPDKIYNVYRPVEEVSHPDAIRSFRLLPIIDEHEMLGEGYQRNAEDKGTHGTTGEDIVFDGEVLYAPIRIFSKTLKNLIDLGKKGLSAGYRCSYEKSSGFFNNLAYDYIQRNIRGNHIALVSEGRMGKDIAVLDSMAFDHFDLALDQTKTEESQMADDDKKKETEGKDENEESAGETEEKKGMTLEEATATLEELLPKVKALQDLVASMTEVKEEAEGAALDEGKEEKKDDKKEGMDSAHISRLEKRLSAVEGRGTKHLLAELSSRDRLAKDLTPIIGTFDHAEKTLEEVVVYACDKLEIKAPKGQEQAALQGYLHARKKVSSPIGFVSAMDSVKTTGKLAKRLNGAKA
jgi:hypothetical protein